MSEKPSLCVLNDWAQANKKKVKFEETRIGMKFERRFVSTIKIDGFPDSFSGTGINKKAARTKAAIAAIASLRLQS